MVHKEDLAEHQRLIEGEREIGICARLRSTVFAEPGDSQRLREVAKEAADTIEELCGALENLLSADPDMPTYQDDYDAAEAVLDKVRS